MTRQRSSNANTRQNRPSRKDAHGTERFARVHNNLVRKDDGLGAVVRAGLTARQLDLMLELIAEAQRQQDTRLEFASRRAADQLGFGRRQRDRKQLISALRALSKMTIPIAVFSKLKEAELRHMRQVCQLRHPTSDWKPDEDDLKDLMEDEYITRKKARRFLWEDHLKKCEARLSKLDGIVPLVRYRQYLDGRLVVRIPKQVVGTEKYFVPAHLTPMRLLRSPQRKILALLILSQPGRTLRWPAATVARKSGLKISAPDQQKVWLRKAMQDIGKIYGLEAGCERGPGSTIVLTLRKASDEQDRIAGEMEHVRHIQTMAKLWDELSDEERQSKWRNLKGSERKIVQDYWARMGWTHRYMPKRQPRRKSV